MGHISHYETMGHRRFPYNPFIYWEMGEFPGQVTDSVRGGVGV